MKQCTRSIIAILTAYTLTTAAFAGTSVSSKIDDRQATQENRIQNGIESGQLTEKEVAKLEQGQQKIQNAEDAAKADGKLTGKERKKLNRMQNREDKKIYQKKHNIKQDVE